MARNAVKMSETEFKSLIKTWSNQLCQFSEDQAEEDAHAKKYGELAVFDQYVCRAMYECFDLENTIFKDLSKVTFDLENCGCVLGEEDPCGFWTTSTGVPTLGCHAGGDWEDPVFFVLYPETTARIRAYIPKKGNTWVIGTATAYGNDAGDDVDDNPRKVNKDDFRADIENRIKVKS